MRGLAFILRSRPYVWAADAFLSEFDGGAAHGLFELPVEIGEVFVTAAKGDFRDGQGPLWKCFPDNARSYIPGPDGWFRHSPARFLFGGAGDFRPSPAATGNGGARSLKAAPRGEPRPLRR